MEGLIPLHNYTYKCHDSPKFARPVTDQLTNVGALPSCNFDSSVGEDTSAPFVGSAKFRGIERVDIEDDFEGSEYAILRANAAS